jgi:hypothetical protein
MDAERRAGFGGIALLEAQTPVHQVLVNLMNLLSARDVPKLSTGFEIIQVGSQTFIGKRIVAQCAG